jgi:hypothetical protein
MLIENHKLKSPGGWRSRRVLNSSLIGCGNSMINPPPAFAYAEAAGFFCVNVRQHGLSILGSDHGVAIISFFQLGPGEQPP